MKKKVATSVLAALAVAVVLSAVLVKAPESSAAPPPCNGTYMTGWHMGDSSSSCWAASQDAVGDALAEAEGRCGAGNVCVRSWDWNPYCTGTYWSNAKLTYGCEGPDF